jgi:hypothetical protein
MSHSAPIPPSGNRIVRTVHRAETRSDLDMVTFELPG